MASQDGRRRVYLVSMTHLTASELPAPCHEPGCPNQAEYGIVTYFGRRDVPLAVIPLCRIHLDGWQRDGERSASDGG
jgi:hypothetical protein